MNCGYIKQVNTPTRLIDKIKYFFNVIEIKNYENGFIIKLPINSNDKIEKIEKVIQKLLGNIQKYKIKNIIFSEQLTNKAKNGINFYETFYKISDLENRKIPNIITGKRLMEYMQFPIFEYILKIQQKDIRQEDVYFLIKKDSQMDFSFLDNFIKTCKTVNIITNDIERFKRIQHNLYEQENILIGVSNNKTKSLKRARYIINVNMRQKEIERLKIYRNAIMIHIEEGVKYNNICFNGININQIKIEIPDEYIEKLDKINELDMDEMNQERFYESILLEKIEKEKSNNLVQCESSIKEINYTIAENILKKDKVKIINLVGNNGIIEREELIKKGKELYEMKKK